MTNKKNDPTQEDTSQSETSVDFETTLDQLEILVEQMETGELSLEASLKAFERGVKLTRECQSALKEAELRIQTLSDENQDLAIEVDAEE